MDCFKAIIKLTEDKQFYDKMCNVFGSTDIATMAKLIEKVEDVENIKCVLMNGSGCEVSSPDVLRCGFHKDFGYGFYCTGNYRQAVRWAQRKGSNPIVNYYAYIPNENLKYKKFEHIDEEWAKFIANCRNGLEHDYDIVEGPMADDNVWNYNADFIAGKMSLKAFLELAKFNYPTHQICFCTKEALKTLTYLRKETL